MSDLYFRTQNINEQVKDYYNLKNEILQTQNRLKDLRKRRKYLENSIIQYLKRTNQSGITYREMKIESKNTTGRITKKHEEKIESCRDVFGKYGIQSNKDLVDDILESLRGTKISKQQITIKKKN